MRVLHVIAGIDSKRGGPIMAVAGLVAAQRAAGLEVGLLATFGASEDTRLVDQLAAAGVQVRLVGPAAGALHRHHDLQAAVEDLGRRSDVVHIQALWEEPQHLAARFCQRAGVPYVICPHGMLDPWSLAQKRLKKRLYLAWRLRRNLDRASAIHYTSETERLACAGLRLRADTIVEPLGVDLTEFAELPARGSFRENYPQLRGRPLVAFLGRIHPGKGLEYLVPTIARLRDPGAAALLVIGPDSDGYRATVERAVADHGIGDRVVFTGMLRGVDRLAALADADLFCLPSDHENFGVAVVEALACGVPAIVSDQVGIHRDVTAAGVGGVVPRDVKRLAEEIGRWLADPQLRQTASERATALVRERYDWTAIARRWAAHYQRLVGTGTAGQVREPTDVLVP